MSVPEGKKSLPKIAFPAGVVVTLALAYLLDSWLFKQTRLARSEGTQNPLHLWTAVSGLVLFTAWLVLSWITLTRCQRSTPISVIVLIVGLFLYAYPSLVFVITWFTMVFFKVEYHSFTLACSLQY